MNSSNQFTQRVFNIVEMLKLQNQQYDEALLLEGTAIAGEETLIKTDVSNIGHFRSAFITGKFQTLAELTYGGDTETIDDGVSHLRGQLIDGAGQRKLFNTHIPLDLILSPGRVRSASAFNNLLPWTGACEVAGPSNNLFYPFEFSYVFTANSSILLYVKNDSDADIQLSMAFWGKRILSGSAMPGAINP